MRSGKLRKLVTPITCQGQGKLSGKIGESFGHVQQITEVMVDCDEDTLPYKVSQTGLARHTGVQSYFFRKLQIEPRGK